MKISRTLLFSLLVGASASAQPYIFNRGIVNAASFASSGLAHAGIARGSIFTIFGRGLGPATGVTVSAFPLANALGGTRVEVCQNSQCRDALPIFARADQVNAILPSNTPLGRNSVRVTYQGTTGNSSPISVVESSVGIFSATGYGAGPGIVQNFESASSLPLNSTGSPARPGQTIIIWLTGLGAGLNADNIAPLAGDLPTPVEVFIGGKLATKAYSGRSPCCSGLDQVVVTIPPDAPLGCYVPLHIRTLGRVTSNSATMAIAPVGTPCRDAHNPFVPTLFQGGKFGAFFGERYSMNVDIPPVAAFDSITEWGRLFLREEKANPFQFHPLFSLPPLGTCTTYTVPGNAFLLTDLPLGAGPGVRGLEAGTTIVRSGSASGELVRLDAGRLEARIGDNFTVPRLVYGNNSELSFSTLGTADIGPIQASVTAPPFLAWTNRSEVRVIRKDQPLTLRWSGVAGVVYVEGLAVDTPNNTSAAFRCVADASTGSFTVPAWALSQMPASRGKLGDVDGIVALGLGPATNSGTFSATGLNLGVSVFRSWTANSVNFQEAK